VDIRVSLRDGAVEGLLRASDKFVGILTRLSVGRLGRLGLEPAVRYERSRPGELVHIDVKKLGRIVGGAGWRGGRQHRNPVITDAAGRPRRTVGYEYVHIAVDDHSRLAYAEVIPDEKATTAAGFLRRAVAFYRRYGIRVADQALAQPPHRPQTNGKAERLIRTLIAGWVHGAIYRSSDERTAALDGWLWHYNHRRRHSALGHRPPVSRTNLPGSYT
jgi:transposase InsO family protein